MADLARIEDALRKADALARQGDKQAAADAKRLADAYRRAKAAAPSDGPRDRTGLESTRAGAAIAGAAQGVSFGLADEMKAGVRSLGALLTDETVGDAYNRNLERERAVLGQMREENPVSAFGGEIAGSLLIPGGAAKSGASVGANALRLGAAGAAAGGAYGFGAGEGGLENRLRSAAVGGALGGTVGAALPVAGRGVQKALESRATNKALDAAAKAAPSVDDLRSMSQEFYGRAAARGVRVKESAFAPLAADTAAMVRDMGAHPKLTPKAWAAMREVEKVAKKGGDVSWQDLETLRKISSVASTAIEPADRRVAGAVVEKVDDFVMGLMDGDLAAGNAVGLSDELKQGRDLWKRMRNSEKLGQAMEAAKDAASGYENGLRIEFRKLIKNRKFFDKLSDGEKAAVKAVVRGTPTGNILKRLGRLSYGSGAQTNFLGASVGGGMGAAAGASVGGPVGAVIGGLAPAVVGRVAAKGSERATERLAQRAQGVVAGGGLSLPAKGGARMGRATPAIAADDISRVVTPEGQEIGVRYEVVDLDDLKAASGDLQPRDRTRKASAEQIAKISAELDPKRLMPAREADRGAPIIGPDNVVESGNGRVSALRRAANQRPDAYKRYVQAIGEAGYDVRGMKRPVLVARRTQELTDEARRRFVIGANQSSIARMSATERAAADTVAMDPAVMSAFRPDQPIGSAGNRDFVRGFMAKLPQSERAALVDAGGALNREGRERIERSVFAHAYGAQDVLARVSEGEGDVATSVLKAMTQAAPDWATVRGEVAAGAVRPELDLTDDLLAAVRALTKARETAAAEGRPVATVLQEAVNQMDMLGGEMSPAAKAFLRSFYADDAFQRPLGTGRIAERLRAVAAEARSVGSTAPTMFGDEIAVDPTELVRRAGVSPRE